MDLLNLIDICREFQQDKRYISGLNNYLKAHQVNTILDVCGGTGFPIIELQRLGWDVTYADGSRRMVESFSQKLSQISIHIPHYLSNWTELSRNVPGKFDFAICRSNSLIYIDSWGENGISAATFGKIRLALQEFYKILTENGILYVDMYKKETERLKGPIRKSFGERIFQGKRVNLSWEIQQDLDTRIRMWRPTLIVNGQRYEYILWSYYLLHEELSDLLWSVGFKDIEETLIEGENVHTVYTAYK